MKNLGVVRAAYRRSRGPYSGASPGIGPGLHHPSNDRPAHHHPYPGQPIRHPNTQHIPYRGVKAKKKR